MRHTVACDCARNLSVQALPRHGLDLTDAQELPQVASRVSQTLCVVQGKELTDDQTAQLAT